MPFFALAAFAALPVALWSQPADLVLRNGKIVTMNAAQPVVQALAVHGGRITALGSDSDAPRWIGPATKVIDLHGHLATPGLIEGHGHFTGIGEFRMGLDLREARTWDDIVAQVARAVKTAKPGEWIIGRGWHQSKWDHAAGSRTSKAFPSTRRSTRYIAQQPSSCSPTPADTPRSSTPRRWKPPASPAARPIPMAENC